MITKEKIIEILHSHSYYVEDQAGNHLIVVDDDSWDDIAEQLTNCNKADVVGQSEQLLAYTEWLKKEGLLNATVSKLIVKKYQSK